MRLRLLGYLRFRISQTAQQTANAAIKTTITCRVRDIVGDELSGELFLVGATVWAGVGLGLGVGVGVGEGVGVGVAKAGAAVGVGVGVVKVTVQLYSGEVKPALSMNWTLTVFCPSPPCSVHVLAVAYFSQPDQVIPSFEKRICATPDTASVALKVNVMVGVSVAAFAVMEPTGGVSSSLIPVTKTCGSSTVVPVP